MQDQSYMLGTKTWVFQCHMHEDVSFYREKKCFHRLLIHLIFLCLLNVKPAIWESIPEDPNDLGKKTYQAAYSI